MALVVLAILGIAWAVVLAFPALRRVRTGRLTGVSDHLVRLNALADAPGHPAPPRLSPVGLTLPAPPRPAPNRPVVACRRQALLVLFTVAAVTLLAAVWIGGSALWSVHLLADLLLGSYFAMLIRLRRRASEPHDRTPPDAPTAPTAPVGRAAVRAQRRRRHLRILAVVAGAFGAATILVVVVSPW